MAFSRTPVQSTEQTKLIPFMHDWNTRNYTNTKDVVNSNILFEPIKSPLTNEDYFEVVKRDGLTKFVTDIPASEIFGTYYWHPDNSLLSLYVMVGVFGMRAYDMSGALVFSQAITISAPFRYIGFTEFLFDSGDIQLIFTDGVNIYRMDITGAVFAITDPDLPVPHRPYPVFLDGYLFLANLPGNVYNSTLNDPTSWNASDLLSAESYPDGILAIARLGQYIVVFGRTSVQFLYDAANPTGTPLATQTTVLRIGFRGGLVAYRDTLLFVGVGAGGTPSVYQIEGLKPQQVQNFSLTRHWLPYSVDSANLDDDGTILGFVLNHNGHAFYVASFAYNAVPPAIPANTYAIDLDTKLWNQLAFQNTGNFNLQTATTIESSGAGFRSVITLQGNSQPYQFLSGAYNDDGVNFTAKFVTPNLDFGTYRTKFGSRVLIQGDQTPSTSTGFLSWSDDDYQTWSIPRAVDFSQRYQRVHRLGSFRRRAFSMTYTDNFPMRWKYLELDYSQGNA